MPETTHPQQEHVHAWEEIGRTVAYASSSSNGYALIYCAGCGQYNRRGPTYYACGVRPPRSPEKVQELQAEADKAALALVEAHKAARQVAP